MKKFILWFPRVLAVLYIAFISLFALDTLGEPQWLLALAIHLIPSYILAFLTFVSWKKVKLGGSLFLATAVLSIFIIDSLLITLPVTAIGILFLASSFRKTA